MFADYRTGKALGEMLPVKKGLTTSDNERFLRFWFEVGSSKLGKKWFKTHKGGEYRKWYGNDENVVNWEDNGRELKNYEKSVI